MTKEEVLNYINNIRINEIDCGCNDGIRINHISYRKVKKLINKIFDDFESKTCNNCKHYNKYGDCEFFDVTGEDDNKKQILSNAGAYIDADYGAKANLVTNKDFGCNRFEIKEIND